MSRWIGCVAVVLVLLGGGPGNAQETAPALVAAAKKEGKVVWYTSVDVKVAEAVAQAFRSEYPGIEVEVERSGSERVLQRINQEYQSDIHNVDVGQGVVIDAPADVDVAVGSSVGVRFRRERCRGLAR